MNIAIVGEGPIGAIVCLLFIYYKIIFSLELNIFFYKRRDTYDRRHILNISTNMLKEIEKLINTCSNCLTKKSPTEFIDISIRCLEYLLNTNINPDYITIYNESFNQSSNTDNKYKHIFLCDGFTSSNRLFYIYDNIKYNPLKIVFNTNILILYGNLDLSTSPINMRCMQNDVIKKQFDKEYLLGLKDSIDMNLLVAFIAIIYNINKNCNKFLEITPFENMKEINLWIDGYTNYENFIEIFSITINYLKILDNLNILSIFESTNVNISENIKFLLMDRDIIDQIFISYKKFVMDELSSINSLEKPFIIHSVVPNSTTFGLILEDRVDKLVYAKNSGRGYTTWLIGDSANSYPPGISLSKGIQDVFILVPHFVKTYLMNDLVIPYLDYKIFDCNHLTYELIKEHTLCNELDNIRFKGGYIEGNPNNIINIDIKSLFIKIQDKQCINDDSDLVNIYNKYQLNNFFINIIEYICRTQDIHIVSNPLFTKYIKYKQKYLMLKSYKK